MQRFALERNISFQEVIPSSFANGSREFNYSIVLPNTAIFQVSVCFSHFIFLLGFFSFLLYFFAFLFIYFFDYPDVTVFIHKRDANRFCKSSNFYILFRSSTLFFFSSFDDSKISPNSLKYSMYVYGWPFFSLQNKLQIVTRYTTDSAPAICENSRQSFDPNNNLQWLTITQDGVTLYLYYFLYSLPVLF